MDKEKADEIEAAIHGFAHANQRFGVLSERGYCDDDEQAEIERARRELTQQTALLYQLALGRAPSKEEIQLVTS